jgi:hypothetical protein
VNFNILKVTPKIKDKLIIVKYQNFYTTCPIKPGKVVLSWLNTSIVRRIDSTSLINYVLNYNNQIFKSMNYDEF